VEIIELTVRQRDIIDIVKKHSPITGDQIAEIVGLSKPTLRSDLSVLVMLGYIDAKPKVGYFLGKVLEPEGIMARQIRQMKVKDIQSVPITLPSTATVHDAVVTMFLEDVGSLVIVEADRTLYGIVSRKDLLKVTFGNPTAPSMPISLVMTRHPNIITITPEETILEAARKMIHNQFDSLPVVVKLPDEQASERLEVIGRISKTHMTRVLVDLASEI
jgi:CBS domain-containing protein